MIAPSGRREGHFTAVIGVETNGQGGAAHSPPNRMIGGLGEKACTFNNLDSE
jgi:hypothetical protein